MVLRYSMRCACAVLAAFMMICTTGSALLAAAPPLEIYGQLPGFEMAKLSPTGKRLAMIAVVADERRLIVTEGETLVLTANVGSQKVRALVAGLVCILYG